MQHGQLVQCLKPSCQSDGLLALRSCMHLVHPCAHSKAKPLFNLCMSRWCVHPSPAQCKSQAPYACPASRLDFLRNFDGVTF